MGLDFGTGSVTDPPQPPDPGLSPDVFASDDLVCVECGTPIMYGGRGPKPKYCDEHKRGRKSTGSRSSSSDKALEQACETLDGYYGGLSMVLLVASPNAAAVWEERADSLNKTNRTFLANNPKLVKRINTTGETTGTAAFIATHVLALASVATVVAADYRAGAAERERLRAEREGYYSSDDGEFVDEGPVTPVDPDFTFRQGSA